MSSRCGFDFGRQENGMALILLMVSGQTTGSTWLRGCWTWERATSSVRIISYCLLISISASSHDEYVFIGEDQRLQIVESKSTVDNLLRICRNLYIDTLLLYRVRLVGLAITYLACHCESFLFHLQSTAYLFNRHTGYGRKQREGCLRSCNDKWL